MALYNNSNTCGEFRQCEIISSFDLYDYDPEADEGMLSRADFIVLATQDCDLLREFEAHKDGRNNPVPNILALEASREDQLRSKISGSDIWRRIKQNQDERYYCLPEVAADFDALGEGVPTLVVDFKRIFCVTPKLLRWQVEVSKSAHRRAFMGVPFRDHFQTRFCYFLQRISLP